MHVDPSVLCLAIIAVFILIDFALYKGYRPVVKSKWFEFHADCHDRQYQDGPKR